MDNRTKAKLLYIDLARMSITNNMKGKARKSAVGDHTTRENFVVWLTEWLDDYHKNELEVELEAIRLLDLIAAEFRNDISSVKCFDLRVVTDVKQVSETARKKGLLAIAWAAYDSRKRARSSVI